MTDEQKEDGSGVYAVVAEFKGEGPLLMEAVGRSTSYESARERSRSMTSDPRVIRVAIVRLEPTGDGNDLLLLDMKRMQK